MSRVDVPLPPAGPTIGVPSELSGAASLAALGWDATLAIELAALGGADLVPGRVVAEHRGSYRVAGADGERPAQVSGRMRHGSAGRGDFPIVGDWVALSGQLIQALLRRRTLFVRRNPGPGGDQLLVSNVDVAFVVTSLNRDFNARRLERYLALVWASGALPVVILSKADLVDDLDTPRLEAQRVTNGIATIAVSVPLGLGLDEVRSHLAPARTAAFLGSSGVGKSTLINALAGRQIQAVSEIRSDDDRGRHTTSGRQLFVMPGGWLAIDTPGLRELGLQDVPEGLDLTFADVGDLAVTCRFSDCAHETEPGCAVRAAISSGTLRPDRLASHRKLQREIDRAAREADARGIRAAERSRWKAIHKAVKVHMARRYGGED